MEERSFSSLSDIEPGHCVRLKVSHSAAGQGLYKVEQVTAEGVAISHGDRRLVVPFQEVEAVFCPQQDAG